MIISCVLVVYLFLVLILVLYINLYKMPVTYNSHATVTFCECAESDRSLQQLGEKASSGFSIAQLERAKAWFEQRGIACILIPLPNPNGTGPDGAVLVARAAVPLLCGVPSQAHVMDELLQIPYDTKMIHYGKLAEKRARHCNVLADHDQSPDYGTRQSTVVRFARVPALERMRAQLPDILGSDATNMFAEVNKYPSAADDAVIGGIGFHGDSERRRVVAARFGTSAFLLRFVWFRSHKVASGPIDVTVFPGDVYIMSDAAVGHDWKCSGRHTLRHAAGAPKYTRPSKTALAGTPFAELF